MSSQLPHKTPKLERRRYLYLPVAALALLIGYQCLNQEIQPSQAQETQLDPVPRVEATQSPTPTSTPIFTGGITPTPKPSWPDFADGDGHWKVDKDGNT